MISAYSEAQLSKYLAYLALPSQYAPYAQHPASFPKTEDALTALFQCQITRFPYDNLSVHYSETNLAEIEPQRIYVKLMGAEVENPTGRGGYCLECSIFFYHALLGLGFDVYMTGVRNRGRIDGIPQGEFRGWTHIVNIIKLPTGQEYHADAAFGGDGATRPLPLISGQVWQNLGPQQVRLVYGNMPKQTRPEQKVWLYQYRNGVGKEWNTFYSFAEFEFFQDDFEVMNRFTSWEARERGNFWVVRFIRNGETRGLPLLEGEGSLLGEDDVSVVGKIMFVNDVVKLNMGGKTRVVDQFGTEEERLRGLKKWFGISI
ncbi:hypothetical protein N7532_001028 [Penicillium argentinense]|uniref:Arylamine N-acetyltransferase n=1 Tax=Penicillium argentinense TaxID=1131581 RepID=A0A9W9G1Z6_9EURO|nr:uncharacterized protein N7532_001028 [Penicillium argentinense]KAJ5110493.1 hypothetical protein N7532_001028 [Penicillium argentinense]